MSQKIGVFEYCNGILTLKKDNESVGEIRFDKCKSKLIFIIDSKDRELPLSEGFEVYIKKVYLLEITRSIPDDPDVEIKSTKFTLLFQNFLKDFHLVIEETEFIPDIFLRIFLCKCFIELLEENNLHLKQYRKTYKELLRLNFELTERYYKDPEDSVKALDYLYYALKGWLYACKDSRYTVFEDEGIDREEEIHKAIFQYDGKIKGYFTEPKDQKNDERFQSLLRTIGYDWFLRSRYDLKSAGKILLRRDVYKKGGEAHTKNEENKEEDDKRRIRKRTGFFYPPIIVFVLSLAIFILGWKIEALWWFIWVEIIPIYALIPGILIAGLLWKQVEFIKMLILRMVGTIAVGYSLLIITQDAWEFSLLYYNLYIDAVRFWEYFSIIGIALCISFLYLLKKVSGEVKDPWLAFKRSISLFFVSAGQSFLIGLLLFDLFADGMVRKMRLEYEVTNLKGIVGHIYPLPLILYASLALIIGIFIQMLWEDKPITETI